MATNENKPVWFWTVTQRIALRLSSSKNFLDKSLQNKQITLLDLTAGSFDTTPVPLHGASNRTRSKA